MKLLYVTQHLPYPPISGARRREYELIKRLSKWMDIVVVAISKVYAEDLQYVNSLETFAKKVYLFQANKLISLESANELNIAVQVNRNSSTLLMAEIANIIHNEKIDIIHLEGFFMYYSIEKVCSNIPTVLCEQNIEYDIWLQQIPFQNIPSAEAYRKQAAIVQRYEQYVWRKVNAIVAVTDDDAQIINAFLHENACKVITNGYNHCLDLPGAALPVQMNKRDLNLLFVGNFDYFPNEDAANFLVFDILPLVLQHNKNVKVFLVGNIGASTVESLASAQVVVTGRIDNLAEYYKNVDAIVCPLRFGGGIKVKVLEALQYNKAIIISPVGLQGISMPDNTPFIVASTKAEFASAIVNVCEHPELLKEKSSNCNIICKSWTTWERSALDLFYLYKSYINEKS